MLVPKTGLRVRILTTLLCHRNQTILKDQNPEMDQSSAVKRPNFRAKTMIRAFTTSVGPKRKHLQLLQPP
uniref:Uncharacterized protein n=1 Tax=Rhizophora mucronata TaxID=61149 RepID=A0A2P2L7P5_RHIMU